MDSFGSRSTLRVGGHDYEIYRLDALDKQGVSTKHLPYSLRILLENLLRTEDGRNVTEKDIRALAAWRTKAAAGLPEKEIAFTPQPGVVAGFYRRAGGGGPGRDARCHAAAFRRSVVN